MHFTWNRSPAFLKQGNTAPWEPVVKVGSGFNLYGSEGPRAASCPPTMQYTEVTSAATTEAAPATAVASHIVRREDEHLCTLCRMWVRWHELDNHYGGKKHQTRLRKFRESGSPASSSDQASATPAPGEQGPPFPARDPTEQAVVPEGHVSIPCYSIAGSLVTTLTLPSDARWTVVAATLFLQVPSHRALPPINARNITAAELPSVTVVAASRDPSGPC